MFEMTPAMTALIDGRHGDPFAVLGPHDTPDGRVVRAFLPGARAVTAIAADGTTMGTLDQVHPSGLFVGAVDRQAPYRLRITWPKSEVETEDPYAFPPLLGPLDLHLIAEGRHRELGRVLGAHTIKIEDVPGVRFAVWAPNAQRVSVVGDFNAWDGRHNPMRRRIEAGVWEIFIPRLLPGTRYKYELLGPDGAALPLKADPCGGQAEKSPANASVVPDPMPPRVDGPHGPRHSPDAPISIYEVHAGSWMRHEDGRQLSWDELGDRLVPYAAGMGFTHIELMPITEHPFDGSWGYQPVGMFAPTSRFGSPDAFRRFVARAHAAGLGIILDWVPAHFPTDPHGLGHFDGTALYEHSDPREGFHQDWSTLIYNFGRHEVRGYLIASALHWLREFGCDGLRVDAVASMLYRDYSRKAGEWVPNVHGGRENLEAISFLKELNEAVAEHAPWATVIAEESTAWPGVSTPVPEGGLGFGFKWNMGWMNDTLHYMERDPIHRGFHYDAMTFGLVYAFSERFILPLSHDEVVHGKGSLIAKMPGDRWQSFANLRAYYGFMWGHPGKKLLFMGCEIAQRREWNHDSTIDWPALEDPMHLGVQRLVRDLNRVMTTTPALHRRDADPGGFGWVIGDDRANSVYAFFRYGTSADPMALVVCNLTPVPRISYRVGVPRAGRWIERINTDAAEYGGSGLGNGGAVMTEPVPAHGHAQSVLLTIPPLATLMLLPEG